MPKNQNVCRPLIGNLMVTFLHSNDIEKASALIQTGMGQTWSRDELKSMVEKPHIYHCYAHYDGGDLYGVLLVNHILENPEILALSVDENYRRKHIASTLLNSLFAAMKEKKCERILLDVAEDNIAAIALYKKFGFNHIDTRRGYYKKSDGYKDAYILEKRL